jgi:hypothetical protein
LPEVTWDTVVKKLLERAGGSAIDVIEFLSRRSAPVVAPPQDAPRDRARLTFTPQQKHKLVKVGAAGAAAPTNEEARILFRNAHAHAHAGIGRLHRGGVRVGEKNHDRA